MSEARPLIWYCNAYPDRVEELVDERLGKAVVLHHADSTEIIPTGELGAPEYGGNAALAAKFAVAGIVGIYRRDGVGPCRF